MARKPYCSKGVVRERQHHKENEGAYPGNPTEHRANGAGKVWRSSPQPTAHGGTGECRHERLGASCSHSYQQDRQVASRS